MKTEITLFCVLVFITGMMCGSIIVSTYVQEVVFPQYTQDCLNFCETQYNYTTTVNLNEVGSGDPYEKYRNK